MASLSGLPATYLNVVGGVEVSLQSLLMSPLCLLHSSFQFRPGGVVCFLVT